MSSNIFVPERFKDGFTTLDETGVAVQGYCFEQLNKYASAVHHGELLLLIIKNSFSFHQINNLGDLSVLERYLPPSSDLEHMLNFFIFFAYEQHLNFNDYVQNIVNKFQLDEGKQKYYLVEPLGDLEEEFRIWAHRAEAMTEQMSLYLSVIGSNYVQDPELYRGSILVELNEKPGIKLTAGDNPILLGFFNKETQFIEYYPLTQEESMVAPKIDRTQTLTDQPVVSNTLIIESKNGPNLVSVKNNGTWGTPSVLLKNTSRTFTSQELEEGIKTEPILLPVSTRTIANVDLSLGGSSAITAQSINVANLFSGRVNNITVSSSDPSKVNAALNTGHVWMGVHAVSVGAATISIVATNEAGSTKVNFQTTVTDSSDNSSSTQKD